MTSELRQVIETFFRNGSSVKEFLGCMDRETKRICVWHLLNYTMEEIAEHLNMPVACVSERYKNGLERAAANMLHRKDE